MGGHRLTSNSSMSWRPGSKKNVHASANSARPSSETHPAAETGVRLDATPETSIAVSSRTQGGDAPVFSTTSQNVMVAALLLRAIPEPSTPEGRRVRQGLHGLLEQAVVQNAESSVSQSHSTRRQEDRPPPNKAPTMQGPPPPNVKGGDRAPSVHERVGADADVRATLEARRRDRDEAESRRY